MVIILSQPEELQEPELLREGLLREHLQPEEPLAEQLELQGRLVEQRELQEPLAEQLALQEPRAEQQQVQCLQVAEPQVLARVPRVAKWVLLGGRLVSMRLPWQLPPSFSSVRLAVLEAAFLARRIAR
jgi:hypothetical protein